MRATQFDLSGEWLDEDTKRGESHVQAMGAPTYDSYDPNELVTPLELGRKVPLWSFAAEGEAVRLSTPIAVSLTCDENLVFAENETFGVFASGETLDEAVRDFADTFVEFFQHYRSLQEDRATGEALRLIAAYRGLEPAVS